MRKVSLNRVKAKVRQYRIQKSKAKANMTDGNVNDYIKNLIALYETKTQLGSGKSLIPVRIQK